MFSDKDTFLSFIHVIFIHGRRLPSSLSVFLPEVIETGHQTKHTVTLNKMTDLSGFECGII